jgi:hypothetical protein
MPDNRLPPEFEKLTLREEPFVRRLLLVGILSKYLPTRPVLVGGNAVEFYTMGGYVTGDIDLVYPREQLLAELLESWGFEREGRHWVYRELGLYVEVPSVQLRGADRDRLTCVEVDGLLVDVIGLEDLLIDRLNAAVQWRSDEDRHWAYELIRSNLVKLDWYYLRRRGKEEQVLALLDELEERARHGQD